LANLLLSIPLKNTEISKEGFHPMALILVIDDQSSIRTILAMVLKDLGHEVKMAEDGEKGIELLIGPSEFDLVITDINMPNKDGNEVARYIRSSRRSTIPVIAITGFPEEAEIEMFNSTIIKPFKLENLRETVARFTNCNLPKRGSLSEGGAYLGREAKASQRVTENKFERSLE
jgi:CheY-like chemotaxis protein